MSKSIADMILDLESENEKLNNKSKILDKVCRSLFGVDYDHIAKIMEEKNSQSVAREKKITQ